MFMLFPGLQLNIFVRCQPVQNLGARISQELKRHFFAWCQPGMEDRKSVPRAPGHPLFRALSFHSHTPFEV